MLKLQRTEGQRIHVSGPCIIEVCKIRGRTKVLVGISADKETHIIREEIMDNEDPPCPGVSDAA